MKKTILLIICTVLLLGTWTVAFFLGRASVNPIEVSETVTFYAKIKTISDTQLLVQGLGVNDLNHRGAFYVTTDSDTSLQWNGTEIAREELREQDTISLTYMGEVQESEPAQIVQPVLRIVVLAQA
ncbi:MAG: hypothetical protein ACK5MN_00650 [Lachnospiraceae bacterium]